MHVRPATPEDADAWAQVLVASSPYLIASGAGVRHDMATSAYALLRLVAVEAGEVVGVCRVRTHADARMLQLQVPPQARGRGTGAALLAAAEDTLRGLPVASLVNGDAGSRAAAARWGFALGREHTMSATDPRTAPPLDASLPQPLPLDAVDPLEVWRCYAATAADDPSGLSSAPSYEEFLAEDWAAPDQRNDLGAAVVEDGRVLAVAIVTAAGDRAWNAFTGTRREVRGRGLARQAKVASLHALAAAGITRCGTGNDAANLPVLAVNAALGYAPVATVVSALRER